MGPLLAIAIGASLGAVLRWRLGLWLNQVLPALPLGTLAANLLGGYLVGLAVAFFGTRPELPPEWRLLVITGFLGGLTTFSTFSAEMVENIAHGRAAVALAGIALHLLGSLACTGLGIASFAWMQRAAAG